MRTIVDLPTEYMKRLALFCKREKISRAEAVRRAVAQLLNANAARDLRAYFGASKTRGSVSRTVRRLRSEWDARA